MNMLKTLKTKLPEIFFILIFLAFLKVALNISLFRYETFGMGKFDLGNMTQAIWNTTRGRFLYVTDAFGTTSTRFGNSHVDIVLLLFVPIFLFFPDPRVLIISQTVILMLGSLPLFLISKKLLKNSWAALLISLAYFLHPAIQNLVLADFHGVTLSAVFLLFAFFFLLTKKFKFAWSFIFLTLMGREDMSLIIAALGAFVWAFFKLKRTGLKMIALGLIWFVATFFIFIPATGKIRMQSYENFTQLIGRQEIKVDPSIQQNFFLSQFPDPKSLLLNPKLIFDLLFDEQNLSYLNDLARPLGFLPYLSPHVIGISISNLLINLLGDASRYRSVAYHHVSIPISTFFLGAIYSIYWIAKRAKGENTRFFISTTLSLLVLGNSFRYAYSHGSPLWPHISEKISTRLSEYSGNFAFFPLFSKGEVQKEGSSRDKTASSVNRPIKEKSEEEVLKEDSVSRDWFMMELTDPRFNNSAKDVLQLLPGDASISIPGYMGAYTAMRESNALFPANYNTADYVVADLVVPQFMRDMNNLDINFIMPELLNNLLEDPNYRIIYLGGGLVVFRKNSGIEPVLNNISDVGFGFAGGDKVKTYERFGINLVNYEYPSKLRVGEKYKFMYEWVLTSRPQFKLMFVTSIRRRKNGEMYQIIHLPSFSLLSTKDWEIGRVYKEEFEVILPKRIRTGEYEVLVGVKSIAEGDLIGTVLGDISISGYEE